MLSDLRCVFFVSALQRVRNDVHPVCRLTRRIKGVHEFCALAVAPPSTVGQEYQELLLIIALYLRLVAKPFHDVDFVDG